MDTFATTFADFTVFFSPNDLAALVTLVVGGKCIDPVRSLLLKEFL